VPNALRPQKHCVVKIFIGHGPIPEGFACMKYERDTLVLRESLCGLQRTEGEKLWKVVFEWAENILVADKVKTLETS
jgi:hypothetical protein